MSLWLVGRKLGRLWSRSPSWTWSQGSVGSVRALITGGISVESIGELEMVVVVFAWVFKSKSVALAALFIMVHSFDTQTFEFRLEIVEHDGIGEALENEGELPPGIDTANQ